MQNSKNPAAAANEAAYREALEEEVTITLEKKKGSALFRRTINATSAAAALNGIACLIREFAATVGLSPVSVLAMLATAITMPVIREKQESEGKTDGSEAAEDRH